jgi:glycerophosphoryl diester phosphodiesterase
VFHNFELDGAADINGPLVSLTEEQLRTVNLLGPNGERHQIPSLEEVLDLAAGKTIVELELKALEIEIVETVAEALRAHRKQWDSMEITCFEPALLAAMKDHCSIPVDILMRASEPWMTPEYIVYSGIQRGRLSGARAVHLQVGQLSELVAERIHQGGFEVHVHGVNSRDDLSAAMAAGIDRFDTDQLESVLGWLKESTHGSPKVN